MKNEYFFWEKNEIAQVALQRLRIHAIQHTESVTESRDSESRLKYSLLIKISAQLHFLTL